MRRALLLLALFVLGGVLLASRFYPRVEQFTVSGNHHYSKAQVLALAHLSKGQPVFWVTRGKLRGLMEAPWIKAARVVRRWPHTVSVTVWERTPLAVEGGTVYAADGTALPGVPQSVKASLVKLSGWGAGRTSEALRLLGLLAPFAPKMLSYSPSGFEVRFANGRLFTPSVRALKAHWAGFMQQHSSVAVYPWGVSVQP